MLYWWLTLGQMKRYSQGFIFMTLLQSIVQWTIYSATTFLEKCRKVVLEKWFFKLGFFFLVNHFSPTWKMWIYSLKPPFFLVNHFSRTRFLEPDFSNQISRTTFLEPLFYSFLEKWLQNKWSTAPPPYICTYFVTCYIKTFSKYKYCYILVLFGT